MGEAKRRGTYEQRVAGAAGRQDTAKMNEKDRLARGAEAQAVAAKVLKEQTAARDSKAKKVVRIGQSPVNPKRWIFALECGHEVWATVKSSKSRPRRKTMQCAVCNAKD